MKIKDLEIKSRSYLNNLILNDNSYIIIDNPLWKVVNEKEEDKGTVFDYKVDSYNLTIIFANQKELKFKNKDYSNILKKDLLITQEKTGFDDIVKIYKNLLEFYNFETKIIPSNKEETFLKGYLVDKEWFDTWKKDTNYDKIKNEFFSKKKTEKEKENKNELIYLYEKKLVKNKDLLDAKKLELNTKEKLEEYLKNNTLVLLGDKFVSSFDKKSNLCEIKYCLLDKQIKISFGSQNELICDLKDNIIIQNASTDKNPKEEIKHEVIRVSLINENNSNNKEDNTFASSALSILLSIFFKEKEFLEKIEDSKNKINNSIDNYSLVNSNKFNEFKQFFSYDDEIEKIINKFNIKSISDINETTIDKILKDNNINNISKKKDFFKQISDR